MSPSPMSAPEAARYYDADDTAAFYRLCWGGSDIHIGRYDTGNETVEEASRAMTRHLLDRAAPEAGNRVLDIACGYGGTLIELVRRGCRPAGIDISGICIARARRNLSEAGLDRDVPVEIGDFHHIDGPADAWDALVCQESIIHSGDRPRVFAEAHRVLRPGGVFALSDILAGEGADPASVAAAFDRLGVRDFATRGDYEAMARAAGFLVEFSEERRGDIATHYAKLAAALDAPPEGLSETVTRRIAASIGHWRSAIEGGDITWACFVLRKPKG